MSKFWPSDRTAVMIDGMNHFSACKAIGRETDYKALHGLLCKWGKIVALNYFGTETVDEGGHAGARTLHDWLEYNGYSCTIKESYLAQDDGSAGRRFKQWDFGVEIAITCLQLQPRIDSFVLFSGNGCFVPLVNTLKVLGSRVTVVSTIKGESPICSDRLRRAASQFVELDNLIGWQKSENMGVPRVQA